MTEVETIDLGDGFGYQFFSWDPDRELNPQDDGIASVEKAGVIVYKDGASIGSCWFDLPECHAIPNNAGPFWTLESLDPLHLEPSIQTYRYIPENPEGQRLAPEYHGHIRNGRWEAC